jgi:hypothetical protein
VDWGVVFGLTGVAVAVISLIYARTQALHVRRQADAANLASTLEVQRAMADRIYQVRMDLARNQEAAELFLAANPSLREVFADGTSLEAAIIVRNMFDGLQDMYFLRKRSIVEDHHWQNWVAAFGPISRMPLARKIYDNAVSRNALDPEFAAFVRPIFEDRPIGDPKGSSPNSENARRT